MTYIFGSIIAGVIVAFIVTGVLRAQLKTVRKKGAASDYVVSGSFHLTKRTDMFLYHTVTRSERPKSK